MSDVVSKPAPDLDAILADTGRIEAALRSAVRGALRDHKRAGQSHRRVARRASRVAPAGGDTGGRSGQRGARAMTEHANVLELDLPEIADRDPYAPPTSHLEKTGADAWSEVPGRRVSRTLLVDQIRPAVDAWRADG